MALLFPTHNTVLRIHVRLLAIDIPMATPMDKFYSRILFASFAIKKFHRILRQRLFFNDRVCFVNLVIHQCSLDIFTFFTQVKGRTQTIVHEHCSKKAKNHWQFTQLVDIFPKLRAHVRDDVIFQFLLFPAECLKFIPMDLFEI